jgi:hypothetical protein
MEEDTLRKFAESLVSQQAADDQRLAEIERVFELVKLALMKKSGVSAVELQSLQTMAVLRAAGRMKAEASRELLRLVEAERRGS